MGGYSEKCTGCDKWFTNPKALRDHKRAKHPASHVVLAAPYGQAADMRLSGDIYAGLAARVYNTTKFDLPIHGEPGPEGKATSPDSGTFTAQINFPSGKTNTRNEP